MAVVELNKAPLSEHGRLALLRLDRFAERLASRRDYLGVEAAESILRVVRELAASEAKLRQRCEELLDVRSVSKYFADGPEGHFFASNRDFAEHLIRMAGYDRDDWTITDLTEAPSHE